MSFSGEVKTELCRLPVTRSCCARAEAYGALLYGHTFSPLEIRVVTGQEVFAERLQRIFRRAFGFGFDEGVPTRSENKGEKSRRKYSLVISEKEKIRQIFAAFGYEASNTLSLHINLSVLEDECCRTSFLRGAFLAGGSVTDPAKRYHLELVTDHQAVSRELYSLLLEMGFMPKDTMRAGNPVTYFKQSEAIEDILTTMGAPLAAMQVMQEKVLKDMRNAVNRKVNCDSANADKIVTAAGEQLAAIRRVEQQRGLDSLPEALQEAALLRIANPEASLTELAMLADPPVSKSCMSHRLRKLAALGESGEEEDA